jgi:hypothetical protein
MFRSEWVKTKCVVGEVNKICKYSNFVVPRKLRSLPSSPLHEYPFKRKEEEYYYIYYDLGVRSFPPLQKE